MTQDNNEYVFSRAVLAQIELSYMSEQVGGFGIEHCTCNMLVLLALVIILILNVHADWRRSVDAAWSLKLKQLGAGSATVIKRLIVIILADFFLMFMAVTGAEPGILRILHSGVTYKFN